MRAGHLLIPLVDFLASKEMHTKEELSKSKLALLFKTNMLDLAMDIYRELHAGQAVPSSMSTRRDEVVANMTALREDVAPILAIVSDHGRVAELKAERCFNLGFLTQHHNISEAHVEVLQRYAKFTYECGDYSTAAQLLSHYRLLTPDADKSFSALWGKLACEILTANWEPALEDVHAIRDLIDSRTTTPPAMQLQQRSWLMHWALFLLGNHPNGRSLVCDLFLQACDTPRSLLPRSCPPPADAPLAAASPPSPPRLDRPWILTPPPPPPRRIGICRRSRPTRRICFATSPSPCSPTRGVGTRCATSCA